MTSFGESDVPDQSQKKFVITGANSGIGYEAALVLAKKGASVTLACRSVEKAEAAVGLLRLAVPEAKLEVEPLDLSDLGSVRAFAERFRNAHERLDCLINNAGVMALPRTLTKDGFEMQIGTNHLGHFALTGLLMDRLAAAPHARIVTVSSQAHRMGSIDFDDMMGERRYDKWRAYGQSKLANLLFTLGLAKRLREKHSHVIAVAAHPGYAATDLQRRGPEASKSKLMGALMAASNAIFAQPASKGALPTLRAATDPSAENGDYYGPGGPLESFGSPVKVRGNAKSQDAAVAERLWQVSEDLTGVRYAF